MKPARAPQLTGSEIVAATVIAVTPGHSDRTWLRASAIEIGVCAVA